MITSVINFFKPQRTRRIAKNSKLKSGLKYLSGLCKTFVPFAVKGFNYCQFIGSIPFATRYSLHLLKCLFPKKPLEAERGDG